MTRSKCSRRRIAASLVAGCAVATVSLAGICAAGQWRATPRFDGAGYAVLARAILTGRGYRAIDHPDRPLHAHFPPGYPFALALTWRITGVSDAAAHALSCLCTLGATIAAWRWLRRIESAPTAFLIGLALAVNWLWVRTGSAIQSEPLFLLLGQLTILASARAAERSRPRLRQLVVLSLLLASCLLTRHVAVGLAIAVVLDLALRRRLKEAVLVAAMTTVLVLPWLAWLVTVGSNGASQAGLLAQSDEGWPARVAQLAAFYVERIPDQITGPFVEVGTRFQSSWRIAITAQMWAILATGVIVTGWLRALKRPRRRLTGLVPLVTLGVLVVWPYTEAGRFLIPLVPFMLSGAVEGLTTLLRLVVRSSRVRLRASRLRLFGACLVLAASLPYSVYMVASGRVRMVEASQQDFDAACDWISNHAAHAGPVISRHPGEVFLRTGRQGLAVSSAERPGDRDADPESVERIVKAYGVAYLLIDQDRYAYAPKSPLERYVAQYTDRVRLVWGRESDPVAVYEVGSSR
jgi:Dolichyl-phosphate-mannose-protein mannosyltransferase